MNYNDKANREDIFKPTTGNESSHEISNDNGAREVNSVTSKNLSKVKCYHFIIFINLLGQHLTERHNQIDHILIEWRQQ
jgi:hypothetical protein